MFPDSFIDYCLENPMETCSECGKEVRTQVMKGTRLCGEVCRKIRDGEEDRPGALTDAGITNLLNQPTGEINLDGIK